ncbi:MAG: hypothetical protein JO257_28690 [Deltaproteobacteria bacterium]|nr:hypothetical protein [Deltaproteobacteria bacterium]
MLATLSVSGITLPGPYARELPAWIAQARGQDWFDLWIAVPWLTICATRARDGARTWSLLLAGAYAYVVYALAIHAFAIHFNALFLVYCTTLGLAGYALIALALELAATEDRVDRRAAHLGGGLLVTLGALFGALWLAEDVPAMMTGVTPTALGDTGLFTNPVHVLDLAFVLPAHALAGVWLWRRHRTVLAQVVLAFGIVWAASIGAMVVATGAAPLAVGMFVAAAASAVVFVRVRRYRDATSSRVIAAEP